MGKIMGKQLQKLLSQFTPVIGVISTKEDNKENWIKAGRAFQNIALKTIKNNLHISVSAAAVEIGENYKELQKIVGLVDRPQMMFRLGYCNKFSRHSPRIGIEEVIH